MAIEPADPQVSGHSVKASAVQLCMASHSMACAINVSTLADFVLFMGRKVPPILGLSIRRRAIAPE